MGTDRVKNFVGSRFPGKGLFSDVCVGSPWVCGRGCLFPSPCRDVLQCMAMCESYGTPGCPCESQTIFCSRLGGGREGERNSESGSRESDSAQVRVTGGGRRHNKGGCREAGNSPGSILDWQPGPPGARETLTTGPQGRPLPVIPRLVGCPLSFPFPSSPSQPLRNEADLGAKYQFLQQNPG